MFHQELPGHRPIHSEPASPWPASVAAMLDSLGITALYSHQAQAVDLIRRQKHVVVATPTASGKTLIYNLPVFEKFTRNVRSRALSIYPLKALAQDQIRAIDSMNACFSEPGLTAAIYDGDVSAYKRRQIRQMPPSILLTNPEMVHLSLLPHHRKWADFLSNLESVVVDEVHSYRGILGCHVAQILRRLRRICAYYHSSPTFVFSSATIGNPGQLSQQLSGLEVDTVAKSGAPQGLKHLVFINPESSPARAATLLLRAALKRQLRTIIYTQSRKMTELIALWASEAAGEHAAKISAYRAGFLPEERRQIEVKLSTGQLLAVISTSALELGIDIGDLDLCILVGYPGSVISTLQRGGRVGRSGQESALVLIAGEDALDQYFMNHPQDFMDRHPEVAVINPYNSSIIDKHLVCAAVERPLENEGEFFNHQAVIDSVQRLEACGELLRSADGLTIYSARKAPHRQINLRGTGNRFSIMNSETGKATGEIDEFRVYRETHSGAIYIHRGDTYIVKQLDLSTRTVWVTNADVDYYTQVHSNKSTEIVHIERHKKCLKTILYKGIIKVTDHVVEYEIRRINGKQRISRVPLDLPPQVFETEGMWFSIPSGIEHSDAFRFFDFMGGLHAVEHAAISIFPLLVLVDRNDLGGLSTTYHHQVQNAAIFIYDGIPGGAGISWQAFDRFEDLIDYTLRTIRDCPCENGCPSCVQSPKCGSGNRPLDKQAALMILDLFEGKDENCLSPKVNPKSVKKSSAMDSKYISEIAPKASKSPAGKRIESYGVFDLETQRSAQEVGGWHNADRMNVSCAVLYDSREDRYFEYLENEVENLIEHLQDLDLVVGFNLIRFDYRVLSGYTDFDFEHLNTLDILEKVHLTLGYRLSLAHLSQATLKTDKTADGLQALRWWKQGKVREIIDYCKADVQLTRELYRFGNQNGFLLFKNKENQILRIPVDW